MGIAKTASIMAIVISTAFAFNSVQAAITSGVIEQRISGVIQSENLDSLNVGDAWEFVAQYNISQIDNDTGNRGTYSFTPNSATLTIGGTVFSHTAQTTINADTIPQLISAPLQGIPQSVYRFTVSDLSGSIEGQTIDQLSFTLASEDRVLVDDQLATAVNLPVSAIGFDSSFGLSILPLRLNNGGFIDGQILSQSVAQAVPLPGALPLMLMALAGLGATRYKRT